MTESQKITIKEYVSTFDDTIVGGAKLDLIVDEIVDRVLLYLNTLTLDPALNRIVAKVIVNSYHDINSRAGGIESSVSKIEDNGQAVWYKENAVKYFSNSDEAIFGSFSGLLASHRRINVITG
jgi:hypothetical protein